MTKIIVISTQKCISYIKSFITYHKNDIEILTITTICLVFISNCWIERCHKIKFSRSACIHWGGTEHMRQKRPNKTKIECGNRHRHFKSADQHFDSANCNIFIVSKHQQFSVSYRRLAFCFQEAMLKISLIFYFLIQFWLIVCHRKFKEPQQDW